MTDLKSRGHLRWSQRTLILLALSPIVCPAWALPGPDRSVPLPPDWTVIVLSDSEAELGWQAACAPEALARHYASFQLSRSLEARAAGRASCRWDFRLRQDAPSSAEIRSTAVPIPSCHALSLWVKNPKGHAVRLRLRLTDADGRACLTPEVLLGQERNWYELAFPLAHCVREDRPSEKAQEPRFPLRSLSVLLDGLEAGQDYTLFLDQLAARRAPSAQLDVVELVTPREVAAGEQAAIRFRLRALSAVSSDLKVRVSLCMNGVAAASRGFTVPVPPEGARRGELLPPLQGTIVLPSFLAAGDYEVSFASDHANISVPGPDRLPTCLVHVVRDDPSPTTSSIDASGSVPVMLVRGEPLQATFALTNVNDDQGLAVLADADPQVVRFRITVGDWESGAACVLWPSRDRLEFADLDRTVCRLLTAAPNALLLPDVRILCPQWWAEENPKELVVLSSESGGKRRDTCPSFSSISWRQDAGDALAATIAHLETGPFADHIAGYQISSGLEGRWLPSWLHREEIGDYSAPSRDGFQGWVRSKYGSLENFRGAWGQPTQPAVGRPGAVPATLSWGEISIPAAKQRLRHRTWLLDPVSHMPVVDYRLFASRATLDTLDALLARAKAAVQARKVCGVAYGHFLELSARPRGLEEGGHLALGPALGLLNIDFLVAPPPAERPGAVMMPTASVLRAGKVLLPSLSDPASMAREALAAAYEGNMPLCIGPRSGDAAFASWPRSGQPESAAQVAVIVDDLSAAFFGQGNPVAHPLLARQMEELRRLGAPVDVWLLDDLLRRRVPYYRMYLFLDVFRMGPTSVRELLDALPGRGEVVIWFCASGALGTTFNGKLMKSLTGITTSVSMQGGPMDVRLGSMPEGLVGEPVPTALSYGLPGSLAPIFQVIPSDVEVLGTDEQGNPTLVRKHLEGRTSIFSAAPNMPAGLLRLFARQAGVHLYSESGDRIYANRAFVAVASDAGGRRGIRLPQPADVYELPERNLISGNTDQLVLDVPAGGVRLLELRPTGAQP